jgi:hypothetical protein
MTIKRVGAHTYVALYLSPRLRHRLAECVEPQDFYNFVNRHSIGEFTTKDSWQQWTARLLEFNQHNMIVYRQEKPVGYTAERIRQCDTTLHRLLDSHIKTHYRLILSDQFGRYTSKANVYLQSPKCVFLAQICGLNSIKYRLV